MMKCSRDYNIRIVRVFSRRARIEKNQELEKPHLIMDFFRCGSKFFFYAFYAKCNNPYVIVIYVYMIFVLLDS